MRTRNMPTTTSLMFFSYCLTILGAGAGGYLIASNFSETRVLIMGVSIILGGLFLAAVVRMFANIGQMLFDHKANTEKLLQNQITAFTRNIEELHLLLSRDLRSLLQEGKTQFQGQNAALAEHFTKLTQAVSQDLGALRREAQTQFQGQNAILAEHFTKLAQDLGALRREAQTQSQGQSAAFVERLTKLSEDLRALHQGQNAALAEHSAELTRSLSRELETLRNILEQVNCDSKEIVQNLHRIQAFFEQIETNLALKK